MTILVTGATGHVGRHVLTALLNEGHKVRAMTRAPERGRFPADVEVVRGDLTEPEGLADALRGVERMYLFPVPDTAVQVVRQAKRAGVRHVVVLSSTSAADATNFSGVYHRTVERAVEDSGLDWTFVRPDEFATNLLWKWGHSIRAEAVVRGPYPQARRALIHEVDVAAVVALALGRDGHAGQVYDLTGPEALDQRVQVAQIAEAVGHEIRFEEVTPEAARVELSAFMPVQVVDMVLGYLAESVDGPPMVLPTVEKLTGRPGTSFARWAADHAAEFRPA
ncbi:NAD-dependent epimerase [Micromonospora arborensis]|uniref:NAD-dependent epimerase n=1 Tax=Micromonospora arborensis TaxID=2116518 RepID=A0A318NCY8_9ACTN|nr:NAD(P)H-binding protein [Micromonospora arborensis]PYC64835.1 NAD-dependent epimerase [Micromonospora arborensis]